MLLEDKLGEMGRVGLLVPFLNNGQPWKRSFEQVSDIRYMKFIFTVFAPCLMGIVRMFEVFVRDGRLEKEVYPEVKMERPRMVPGCGLSLVLVAVCEEGLQGMRSQVETPKW